MIIHQSSKLVLFSVFLALLLELFELVGPKSKLAQSLLLFWVVWPEEVEGPKLKSKGLYNNINTFL